MFSRRNLLKLTALGVYLPGLLAQEIKKQEGDGFYMQINFFGAPSRWLFDLPIFPYENKQSSRNLMVGNEISSLEPFLSTLNLTKIGKVNYPDLWGRSYTTSKGVRNLSQLYENMVTIRGCDMSIDGHEVNSQKLLSPFGIGDSLDAHIASFNKTDYGPIHLLQKYSPMATTPGAYHSSQGIAAVNLFSGSSYGTNLFSYDFNKKNIIKENRVLAALAKLNGFSFVESNIFNRDLKELEKQYEKSLLKYQGLLEKNYNEFKKEQRSKKYLSSHLKFDIKKNADQIRKEHGALFYEDHILQGDNIREIALNLNFPKMAEKFAICEIIALNKLSSASVMMLDPPEGVHYRGYDPESKKIQSVKNGKGTFDTHNVGAVGDILISNAYYSVLVSLLNEFVITLKDNNRFKNSLIHITSEFDRTPRKDLSGSDHGFQGHTSTLIGGQFKGTECVGNIFKNYNEPSALHPDNGIWGAGAPLATLSNRNISYRNITSTVCYLLKIKSLTPSDVSLVSVNESGKLVLPIGRAKNV